MKALLSTGAVVAMSGLTAFAAGNGVVDFEPQQMRAGQHEEIRTAMENDDYATWASLMAEDTRFSLEVTEDTFEALKKMHELREEGEFEEAREMAEELGLPEGPKHGHGGHENMDEIRDAIENGDYDAWATLMAEDARFPLEVSEDTFDSLVEMHELREAGEFEEAREMSEELGLPGGPGEGRGGHGMGGMKGGFGGQGK